MYSNHDAFVCCLIRERERKRKTYTCKLEHKTTSAIGEITFLRMI